MGASLMSEMLCNRFICVEGRPPYEVLVVRLSNTDYRILDRLSSMDVLPQQTSHAQRKLKVEKRAPSNAIYVVIHHLVREGHIEKSIAYTDRHEELGYEMIAR